MNATVISLFSGAGGLDYGFEAAGLRRVFVSRSILTPVTRFEQTENGES